MVSAQEKDICTIDNLDFIWQGLKDHLEKVLSYDKLDETIGDDGVLHFFKSDYNM